jgi:hypothetical protein
VEDVDPEADVEESVATKNSNTDVEESDTGNSNDDVGVKFGCEGFKVASIRGVGGGYCNSTVEESSCVMDSCAGTN